MLKRIIMEDLILTFENGLEDCIIKIIEFVKQVEREQGLTDEQIVHKYTCGSCGNLALRLVKPTLERLFGEVEELEGVTFDTCYAQVPKHTYLKLKRENQEDLYFDIFGVKTLKQVEEFLATKFWEKEYQKPWVKKFEKEHNLGEYLSILQKCYQYIKTNGVEY